MKTLQQYINESYAVNEAFDSKLLTDIFSNSVNKRMLKTVFKSIPVQWSAISDDDIEVIDDMSRARRRAKDSDNAMVIWLNRNTLIGVSSGNWVHVSTSHSGRHGYNNNTYEPVLAMSKQATTAYAIAGPVVSKYRDAAKAVRDERWARKSDAAAFKSNDNVRRDSLKRYRNLKAKAKNDEQTK